MLQQTRVSVATSYYLNFMRLFPSVEALAAADESKVLSAWSGLGYYRRARMLHLAARRVVNEFGGELPRTADGLRQLNGIGRYTAAAIASIAFQQPAAAVDGNIERVLSRILKPLAGKPGGGERERPWQAAGELLSPRRPGDFNQAMMELGATSCLPREPLCTQCPVHDFCAAPAMSARETGMALTRSESKPNRKVRQVAYALSRKRGRVLLLRRSSEAGQMPAMWELPPIARAEQRDLPAPVLKVNHSITDTIYRVSIHLIEETQAKKLSQSPPSISSHDSQPAWVHLSQVHTLPLTGLCRKVLGLCMTTTIPSS